MSSLVSVIIPIYNAEKFIKTCINSVLTQTYPNIETILVNDGSIDSSKAICEEIANNTSNIILINQQNCGVSAARNAGLKFATGKYVTFLDADDELPPNAIKQCVEAAETADFDMVIGKATKNEPLPIGTFNGEQFLIKILEDNCIGYYAWRILYKREFVKNLSFINGCASGEDTHFVFECSLKKPKVVTIDEQVYIYKTNLSSQTHTSYTEKKYQDVCELTAKKEDLIARNYPHLMPLFYHLKVKLQMNLLANLSYAKGKAFSQHEKETLIRFHEFKEYFRPELPDSDLLLYKLFSQNLYTVYKGYRKVKFLIKMLVYRLMA